MSLHPPARDRAVDRLGPADLLETFAFLDRDPTLHVYLLALALRDGLAHARDEFWAARRDGEIAGLVYLGAQSGAVLPIGDDAETLAQLAERVGDRLSILPRRWQVIGPRRAVSAVVRTLARQGHAPRLHREQTYMVLERADLADFERLPELRPAKPEDHALVFESGARLRAEELEEDPRDVDAAAYARRVEEECRDGYTWLWMRGATLCFRASVSALTADAAQVSGVFTPLGLRNRGNARRGLAELCARLLERSRTVCLFVNDFNASAIAVYRRIGFRPRAEWASAFYVGGR